MRDASTLHTLGMAKILWSTWSGAAGGLFARKKRKTLQCVGGGSLTAGHAGNCNTARSGRGN